MPDMNGVLFKIYDEYILTCKSLLENINSDNMDYLNKFIEKKGQVLNSMLIQEKICNLNDTEIDKKNMLKNEILKLEKKIIESFKIRYDNIKHEIEVVKNKKKINKKYNNSDVLIGRNVDFSE